MKIAILLSGHLRSWEYCKPWFEEKFIDSDHEIDIFVDTYNELESSFPTNYQQNIEENKLYRTNDQIKALFTGLNVVDFNIESEFKYEQYKPQADKIKQGYNLYKQYITKHNKTYDLVVRSRFDLILENKLNYNFIHTKCTTNPRFLFQSHINGINFGRDLNDQFAVSNPDVMDLYFRRFTDEVFPADVLKNWCIFHSTLPGLTEFYGIERDWETIHNALVRTAPNETFNIIW